MKTLVSSEKNHPWISYEEAAQKLEEDGYVRIDGHSASNKERLDRLFNEIKPAKEAGTYGVHLSVGDAAALARKTQVAADSGVDLVALQAENAELKAKLAAIPAAPAAAAKAPAADSNKTS